jgi:endogenous inhibitor of DNA gyrase (YacG/DUF329 family)
MIDLSTLTDAQLVAATSAFEPEFNPKNIEVECTHCGTKLKVGFNRKDKPNFCSDRCRNAERDEMARYRAASGPTIPSGHVAMRARRGSSI